MIDTPGNPLKVPELKLKSDTNSGHPFVAGSSNRYAISVTIQLAPGASGPWKKHFRHEPRLEISIPVGTGKSDLCTQVDFDRLEIQSSRATLAKTIQPSGSPLEGRFILTPTGDRQSGDYISRTRTLTFKLSGIILNAVAGSAEIGIVPGWRPAAVGIRQQRLAYTVQRVKQTQALNVTGVHWDAQKGLGKMGLGTLSWQTSGRPSSCYVTVNGEKPEIKKIHHSGNHWHAPTLLEGGLQEVAVTAKETGGNSVTALHRVTLSGRAQDFGRLEVSTDLRALCRPVSLVQVDPAVQEPDLYGVFQVPGSPCATRILKNSHSGTQNNWADSAQLVLPPGYETSPCARLNGKLYAVFGSAMDPNCPQASVQRLDGSDWDPLSPPASPFEPIMGQAVTVFDGKIWVIGGFGASGATYHTVYALSPGPPASWELLEPLPRPLCMASAAVCTDISGDSHNRYLYVFGGYESGPLSEVSTRLFQYNPAGSPSWSTIDVSFPSKTRSRGHMATAAVQNPTYWFLGAVRDRLYVFLQSASGSSTWYFDKQRPKNWVKYSSGDLQSIAIKPLSGLPYGISAVPRTFAGSPPREALFFMQAVGEISSPASFKSIFAFFEPS